MRTVVLINAHSRQARQHIEAVDAYFAASKNFQIIETIIVRRLDKLDSCIKRLQNHKDAECIIVGSGDGTIVAVLNGLKDRKGLVYGFLPLGTSNTFVRSLNLPITLPEALAVLNDQHTRMASLGSINGDIFANIAGVGVPTRVANNLTNRVKRYLGPFAYVMSGFRELLRHDAVWCELDTGNEILRFYTHHLLIANGKYHGHLPVSQSASVHNDKLVMIAFGNSKSRWRYAGSMLKFSLRMHEADGRVLVVPFEKATLRTRPVRGIEADGELIGQTPAELSVIKDAITVFTPAQRKVKAGRHRKTRL